MRNISDDGFEVTGKARAHIAKARTENGSSWRR